jgi:hypothetical protein
MKVGDRAKTFLQQQDTGVVLMLERTVAGRTGNQQHVLVDGGARERGK